MTSLSLFVWRYYVRQQPPTIYQPRQRQILHTGIQSLSFLLSMGDLLQFGIIQGLQFLSCDFFFAFSYRKPALKHTNIVCFALNGSICTFAQQLTFHVWKHQEGLTFRGAPKMGDFLLYTIVPYFGLFFLKNMTHSLDSDCNQTSNNNNFKCNAGDACPKGVLFQILRLKLLMLEIIVGSSVKLSNFRKIVILNRIHSLVFWKRSSLPKCHTTVITLVFLFYVPALLMLN